MLTDQSTEQAYEPLTQKDRERLAWYLGNRTESHHLTRADIDSADLEAWAATPRIARQIAAFRSMNARADEFIHQGARIDAIKAVSEDLRATNTSADRLRAVNAYIRLISATARSTRHRTDDSARTPRPRPDATPRDPDALPPLPLPVPHSPTARTAPTPNTNGAHVTGTCTTGSPRLSEATSATPTPNTTDACATGSPRLCEATSATPSTPAPVSNGTGARSPAPINSESVTESSYSSPSFAPSIPSSSTPHSDPSPRSPRLRDNLSPSPMETSGAAPAGAWT